ncbi:hypothetical protein CBM2589_B200147 [Cupriavidus taiwanensis]|uniref:Uncharacterized protein n=1 Tax=Cupriavidus taiwanensis TaxID=164546 RepID=A0A375BM97_9BURK|nr:hypothetical protein CBM2589_B200147 [Cupriavidus taiwanensis]
MARASGRSACPGNSRLRLCTGVRHPPRRQRTRILKKGLHAADVYRVMIAMSHIQGSGFARGARRRTWGPCGTPSQSTLNGARCKSLQASRAPA